MAATDTGTEAEFYRREDNVYICGLCPHRCRIRKGEYGLCSARYGDDNILTASSYGMISSICADPVEKKPLYHYHPGSEIFSVGGTGCNMRCLHCQNHSISQPPFSRTAYVPPKELVRMCRDEGLDSIAFTYNEPSIWFEYIRDVIACAPDLRFVLVTNGLISEEPLRKLCGSIDAMNIDVKGFTDDFYVKVCGAHLVDVLRTAKIAFEENVHIELTYLLIPGHNDSEKELREFSSWVKDGFSPNIPVHFTRFHPDNRMTDVPCTPYETMISAREIALSEGLRYVYLGNISVPGCSDTVCPECGTVVIRRNWYSVDTEGLNGNRCRSCGNELFIRDRTG